MQSHGEQLKGNWRTALGKKYLAAEDIDKGKELALEIESVTREEAVDPGTKQSKTLVTVHFKGTDRALALNVTNARRISALVGSNRVEQWPGHKIVLHIENGKAFGKVQPLLRVKEAQ